MKRTITFYIGLTLGILIAITYGLLADSGEPIEVEQLPLEAPKGTAQSCIPMHGELRCSFSQRSCKSDDDCAPVLVA